MGIKTFFKRNLLKYFFLDLLIIIALEFHVLYFQGFPVQKAGAIFISGCSFYSSIGNSNSP